MYVGLCTYMDTYTHTHAFTPTHIHTLHYNTLHYITSQYITIHTHTHIHTLHTYIHYIYIYTYIHYIHTYIHTLHIYIHYIHTLHTHIHTHTCVPWEHKRKTKEKYLCLEDIRNDSLSDRSFHISVLYVSSFNHFTNLLYVNNKEFIYIIIFQVAPFNYTELFTVYESDEYNKIYSDRTHTQSSLGLCAS